MCDNMSLRTAVIVVLVTKCQQTGVFIRFRGFLFGLSCTV